MLGRPALCKLHYLGSVTILVRKATSLGQGTHWLFPGVLELSAEFWLLLMTLCGCLGSVIPVWCLMTASPPDPAICLFWLHLLLYAPSSEKEERVATSLHQPEVRVTLSTAEGKKSLHVCSGFGTGQTLLEEITMPTTGSLPVSLHSHPLCGAHGQSIRMPCQLPAVYSIC